MIRLFLWVLVCLNGECECERIEYHESHKNLYLKTDRVEYDLYHVSSALNQGFKLMRQDTSYYVVYKEYKYGLVVFVHHVKGGRPKNSGIRNERVKIDNSLIVMTDFDCFCRCEY